jgi:hypothetical protein
MQSIEELIENLSEYDFSQFSVTLAIKETPWKILTAAGENSACVLKRNKIFKANGGELHFMGVYNEGVVTIIASEDWKQIVEELCSRLSNVVCVFDLKDSRGMPITKIQYDIPGE